MTLFPPCACLRVCGSVSRYIRRVATEAEANLEKRPVLIDHHSAQHARLALFAKRAVANGEELTVCLPFPS